jgi:uncharacterized membrane protein YhaH (DUF805 family)
MGSLSIWHWVLVIVELWLTVVFWIAAVRLLNRLGYSGWWSLLIIVPIVNVIAFSRLSKAQWPVLGPNS